MDYVTCSSPEHEEVLTSGNASASSVDCSTGAKLESTTQEWLTLGFLMAV